MRAGYDGAGRQVWQEQPDGTLIRWVHDEGGDVAGVEVDGRRVATFERDPAERRLTVLDETDPGRPTTLHVAWDAQRRVTERGRDGRTVAWKWDRAGRCTQRVAPDGTRTRYARDSVGRLIGVDAAAAGAVDLVRDQGGRLLRAVGGGTTQEWRHHDGFVVRHTLTAGPVRVETALERDDLGRITAVVRDGVRTDYAYDVAGQLVEARTGDDVHTWSWDAAGRLVAESDGAGAVTYDYDAAGQLLARHAPHGTTTYAYAPTGRRVAEDGPSGRVTYRWSPLGWLTGIEGPDGSTSLHVDALGELARVDDSPVFWDGHAPAQVGDTPVVRAPGMTAVGSSWQTTGWREARSDAGNPWSTPSGAKVADAAAVGASGTLSVSGLEWLTARAFDASTRSFLGTDPLDPTTGAPWAGNPYSYAGNDPLQALDPTGLAPATDADLQAYAASNNGAFAAVGDWVCDNWEYIAGAGMIVLGGALVAFGGPVGGLVGGSLIGAGLDTIVQKATTGSVDWGQVGIGFAVGLIPFGGYASRAGTTVVRSVAQRVGATGVRATVINGAASGFVSGIVTSNYAYFTGDGPHTVSNYLQTVTTGTVVSTVTGVASQGVADGITAKVTGTWPNGPVQTGGGTPPTHAGTTAAEVPFTPSVDLPPSGARFMVDSNGVVTDLELARFVVDPSGVVTDREAARFIVDTTGSVLDTAAATP